MFDVVTFGSACLDVFVFYTKTDAAYFSSGVRDLSNTPWNSPIILVTSACVLMCIDSHIGFCNIDKLYHKYLNSAYANNMSYLFQE